ncbi:MAG: acyl-CoA carboxylase subunit epsilon [Cryobacterium sp.]
MPTSLNPAEIVFVTNDVTAAEVSAVTAVLQGVLQEESDGRRRKPAEGQSAWQQSMRPLRRPLHPGPAQWRGFSG